MEKGLEGRILKNPTLLIAPRTFILSDDTREDFYQDALERFIRRYDMLTQECDVKVLGAKEDTDASHKYWRFIEDFEKLRPDAVIRLNVKSRRDTLATIWPRDVFQVYGDLVISTPGYEEKTREILLQLGVKLEGLKILSSNLGQGGYVVRDKNILILSSKVLEDPEIPHLKNKGYTIYFLPVPSEEDKDSDLVRRMSLNYHIDTEFNLVFSPDGNALICVNGGYYSRFQEQVDSIVEAINGKMYIIPEDSVDAMKKATNFIKLPNGKVMLPNYCSATQKFLEEGLGKNNVLVAEIDPATEYSGVGGGLRCMSNLIE